MPTPPRYSRGRGTAATAAGGYAMPGRGARGAATPSGGARGNIAGGKGSQMVEKPAIATE